jgi:hypothetical protein
LLRVVHGLIAKGNHQIGTWNANASTFQRRLDDVTATFKLSCRVLFKLARLKVGSRNGDLSILAGNTMHVTGSDLVAVGNLAGTTANVIIDAAIDTSHQAQTQKTSSSGLTIGLAAPACRLEAPRHSWRRMAT